ncbi:U-box domain-containing protein 45 [Cucurbita argyrosperma subsp. argyrosperma]|nr:U-box domain-containing protein 45 [Cucurbita argyrosperma subsp. argyrosperma]
MDVPEVEEIFFAAGDAKLHGEMYKKLAAIYGQVMSIFPSLEAARPRSKTGIQALCSLHVALEKAKNTLRHCSESSKLYLAITGDAVLAKFEKARCSLEASLICVEDIVSQSIGFQIQPIVNELKDTVFLLDPLEKQVGDDIIALLLQERKFDDSNGHNELEHFHMAATKLGITSSKAALTERRALKRLVERARLEEDKRKESIVAYLLHLMRKYSKLFRSEVLDDTDSQGGSTPCSPTVRCSLEDNGLTANGQAFEQQLSKLSSFNFKPNYRTSGKMPLPPEELRCPISLQLMYDPVIIDSGQTYERICIEKWFSDGHKTCPKTQQRLSHLSMTPNYSVKGLIANWCEHNGVPIPDGPPTSLDLNYWRLALSDSESGTSRSVDNVGGSHTLKEVKVVPLEESGSIKVDEENEADDNTCTEESSNFITLESCVNFMTVLTEEGDLRTKCRVVEQIRLALKDDDEARILMGANGFAEALMEFLTLALIEENGDAQESGAMALFNLSVNNNRNREMMIAAGVISLLENMILKANLHGPATALYLNLSCLEDAKPIISSSRAVPFLIQLLTRNGESQTKLDALHTLYNLSTTPSIIPVLLSAGVIAGLQSFIAAPSDSTWTETSLAILINIASTQLGIEQITSAPELISGLAAIVDAGERAEQEQAVSCLLTLCRGSERCSQMVLQEGVIPGLVAVTVNGSSRGKIKAQKLLMLFREQRQKDTADTIQQRDGNSDAAAMAAPDYKPLCKSVSKKKMGKALSFFAKSKRFSLYQC